MSIMSFSPCEICGAREWSQVYHGRVRDGVFGSYREGGVVARCGRCGVSRLAEEACIPSSYYETDEYRSKLKQGLGAADYFAAHDELQLHTLRAIWPRTL